MAVIDMDSHLRDGYFLDEIYDLQGEFSHLKPKKLNNPEDIRETEFEHEFTPSSSPQQVRCPVWQNPEPCCRTVKRRASRSQSRSILSRS